MVKMRSEHVLESSDTVSHLDVSHGRTDSDNVTSCITASNSAAVAPVAHSMLPVGGVQPNGVNAKLKRRSTVFGRRE